MSPPSRWSMFTLHSTFLPTSHLNLTPLLKQRKRTRAHMCTRKQHTQTYSNQTSGLHDTHTFIYICIYIYIYCHSHIIHTHTHTYTHARTHTHICTHTHTHARAHTHTRTRVDVSETKVNDLSICVDIVSVLTYNLHACLSVW